MSSIPSTPKGFRQLTALAAGCALLLVMAGVAMQAVYPESGCLHGPGCDGLRFSQALVWTALIYSSLTGIYSLLTLAIAILAWRTYRLNSLLVGLAWGSVVTAGGQVAGAAGLAWFGRQPLVLTAFLAGLAACLTFSLLVATVAGLPAPLAKTGIRGPSQRFYWRWLLFTAAAMLLLLLTGGVVASAGAGPACAGWPLCRGEIFPADLSLNIAIHLLHRFTVVAVGMAVAAIVLQTRRRYADQALLVRWSTSLGVLFLAEMGVGGLNAVWRLPDLVSAAHLTLAIMIWASLVVLIAVFYLTAGLLPAAPEAVAAPPLTAAQKAGVYFKLTKPWILVLLLITTIGAMFIAAGGRPPLSLILYTLLGGALAASGASVLNSYLDSDIDQLMSRTSRRPTVTGLVTPQETLFFGLALSTLSFLVFALFVNPLSAGLSTLGILYYVFFYTLYLKRATIHNIIIGGAAGAIPPLVGWTAVTNSLDLGALYLFAIIFFWTPPHTWALALLVKKDYANARVPMLPVVAGEQETIYQIFLYSILLVTLTLLPFAARVMGWLYLLGAVALGLPFLYLAWALWRNYSKSSSKKLYKFSQLYLALLFLIMALDRTLF